MAGNDSVLAPARPASPGFGPLHRAHTPRAGVHRLHGCRSRAAPQSPHPPRPRSQDAVFLDEVGNDIGLVAVDPAREGHEEDLERVGRGEHGPFYLARNRRNLG